MKPSKSHSSVWTLNEVARPADGCHSGVEVAYKFRPLPVASMHFLSNRSEKLKSSQRLYLKGSASFKEWWLGRESNPRHEDFQSSALPTELPSLLGKPKKICSRCSVDKRDGGKSASTERGNEPLDKVGAPFSALAKPLKTLSTATTVGTSSLRDGVL